MSNRLIENADEITRLAAAIQALADGFDTAVDLPDSGGSIGCSIEGMQQAVSALQKHQEALKELMLKTVEFLKSKGATITDADVQERAKVLEESGFFG